MTALYRHFDKWGTLLYVGIANDVTKRLDRHRQDSRWHGHIATITVSHFDTRGEALDAEKAAIKTEGPIFNVAGAERGLKVKGWYAVLETVSTRVDGWYTTYVSALEQLEFWRIVSPEGDYRIVKKGEELSETVQISLDAAHLIYDVNMDWGERLAEWEARNSQKNAGSTCNTVQRECNTLQQVAVQG